ncbi:MAG: phosphodiester glycosidase family protein [Anaerolineae bacterium]|nr:phosphodiester glycosidase family protein [Anaerolineae bacterium]
MLRHSISIGGLFLIVTLLACGVPTVSPTPAPTPLPGPTVRPTSTAEPPDTGWVSPEPGVEVRQVLVPSGDAAERVLIVRLDAARFHVHVRYAPGAGQLVSQWAAAEAARSGVPLLVVNAGYFTPEYEATGLLVSEGRAYGTSYGAFAGMFAALPGGRVEVRWLAEQPYDPSEMVLAAVQSFPVLVKPGGVMGFPPDADDGRPARRTVVAQDRAGRILFVVAPRGYLSLHEMARWLVASDLDVDVALNLDGGTSSGLVMPGGVAEAQIDSLASIPAAIVVARRE